MPHHVARLLTLPGLPLSSILQAAAAQAWSRRAHLNRTRAVTTKDTPASSFVRAAPSHMQPPPATFENNAPDRSSAKVHTETTPTSSFTRAAAPRLQPSSATSENAVQDRSSRSIHKRTSFAASENPTSKPIHNTSVRPQYSRHREAPFEDVEGRGTVFHFREIIPEPTPKMTRSFKLPRARPIRHKTFSIHDFDWRDPGRVADIDWSDPPLDTGTPICKHTETLPHATMKQPTSPKELYRNLLRLISNGPFNIRSVINYHSECPKSIHSTKSFNLLIGIALRHASFEGVGSLLNAMDTEGISRNLETWKLHVRWLIRTARWNEAWKLVFAVREQKNASTMRPNDPIPLDLWLELFGSQKRGALRHWVIRKRAPGMKDSMEPVMQTGPGSPWEYITSDAETSWDSNGEADFGGGWKASPTASSEGPKQGGSGAGWDNGVEGVGLLPSQIYHGHEKRLVSRPWQRSLAVEKSQYRALMQVSPLRHVSDDARLSPRTILIITRAMLLVGDRSLALSTALSYLASLPLRLRRSDRRIVLDLVHLHLAMVTRRGKPGLKQHFAQRRVLRKFLDARPNLTPTSLTLFLLLGPLRGCRRGGTLAMQCLRLFEKRWGSRRMQSKLVRRRIANLALKEGRLDIARTVIKSEWKASRGMIHNEMPRVVSPARRIPWREMFGRRGVWNRRWRMIEEKYYWRSRQLQ